MRKILRGICLVFLISHNGLAGEGTITVDTLAHTGLSWDGSRLPAYPKETPEITILRITIPAGAELPKHRHPVINAGVLLSGELTVVTEDDHLLHVKAGDAIVEVVGKWHYGKNEGKIPAVILVFYAGRPAAPVTTKK